MKEKILAGDDREKARHATSQVTSLFSGHSGYSASQLSFLAVSVLFTAGNKRYIQISTIQGSLIKELFIKVWVGFRDTTRDVTVRGHEGQ